MSAASPTSLAAVRGPAAGYGKQRGDDLGHSGFDVPFELVGLAGEVTYLLDFAAGQVGDYTIVAFEHPVYLVEDLVTVQRPGRRVVSGFEFVESPPQTVLRRGSVLDQGLSVIGEEFHFAGRACQVFCVRLWFMLSGRGVRGR